jgi:hypothetical protein
MLQNNMIPPHVGIKERINSKFPPLDTLNVHIAKCPTEFKRRADKSKRTIVVNNFDAAVSSFADKYCLFFIFINRLGTLQC